MPLSVVHLRRWFAGGAIAAVLTVAGVYFYARHRVQNALEQVPGKIGVEIKQSATGFTISRSEQGRTLFKIEASKAVQFKAGGRAELHDVAITLYGRDSSRFDHIYGSDFEYDPQSGDVSAKGEIEIDLEANPAGILNPDQATPTELKNPIHLKTSGLVFNQKTGNAYTKQAVEFRLPQATGSAVGVTYTQNTGELILESGIRIVSADDHKADLTAARARITKNPRQVVLEQPRFTMPDRQCRAQKAVVFLRPNNTIDRVMASGDVQVSSATDGDVHADQLELAFTSGVSNLRTAVFSGNVHVQGTGQQPMVATAGRMVADFAGRNVLTTIQARENVRLIQHPSATSRQAQDLEITAPGIDFVVAKGNRLDRAVTTASSQIVIRPASADQGSQTLVSASRFIARFNRVGQLASLHGEPDARVVNQNPGQPDRVSTSHTIDASFHPSAGIESIVQQGEVTYTDGERKVSAERARYAPRDQTLALSGSPRVVEAGATTTADAMRFSRATGEGLAEGSVKTTYSDLKAQANGALLASGSPIHVTARSMTLKAAGGVATYSGNARLWQDANVIEAPSIEFDREHRWMLARGSLAEPVSTVVVQADKNGKTAPVAITSTRLTYADEDRKAHLDGNVLVKAADVTITSRQTDAYLQPRGSAPPPASGVGKLEKIVALGGVVITEPGRRATGEQLTYQASEDKFVLSGGPPSIFDAEHGKVTGVSLTFYRHDDTVLVEGNSTSPAVTQTRVAR